MPRADHRILVIESEGEHRGVIYRALAEIYPLVDAVTGKSGIDLARTTHPDCILLERSLPDCDGLELIPRLLESREHVSVIALLDHGDESGHAQAMSRGAVGCLTKDAFSAERVLDVVEQAVRTAGLKRELDQARQDFVYFTAVFQEGFKGPLREITEAAQGIQHATHEELGEREDSVVRNATTLIGLAERIAEYTFVGRSNRPFSRVDLNTVLRQVLISLESAIQQTRAQVESEPLPQVFGDRIELQQLMEHLLGNAIKFQGPGSPVIRIRARASGGLWEISVQDNGVGIDPGRHAGLFVPRAGRADADHGLGLAICRRIVESHGGRIRTFSEAGRGSVFQFTIPASSPPPRS